MRFPQAYVFFKKGSTVTEQDVRGRFDESIEIAFIKQDEEVSSALNSRVKHARHALSSLGDSYYDLASCAVISTRSIDEFFKLKFSQDIAQIMWVKSASDSTKIRSTLTLRGRYWHVIYGINEARKNYRRIVKIIGNESHAFTQNDLLFTDLENYGATIYADLDQIFKSFTDRLQGLCHVGKFSI